MFPPKQAGPGGPPGMPPPGMPPMPGGPPPPGAGPPSLGAALGRPTRPIGPKPGQGMDPHEAMMGGLPDMSQFAPPAPEAPLGPDGLPIGGGPMEGDPNFDPSMDGSSLFQALQMGLGGGQGGPPGMGDPGMGGMPPGGGQPDLESLLQLLALQQAGLGGGPPPPSGAMSDPTNPGQMIGMQNQQLIQ